MALAFENQAAASFKFNGVYSDSALTISQISGRMDNADNFLKGIKGLLYIGNKHENYSDIDGTRTVKQNVINVS